MSPPKIRSETESGRRKKEGERERDEKQNNKIIIKRFGLVRRRRRVEAAAEL